MELKVGERLGLLNLLPQEGDVVTIRIVRDLQTDLGLSEDEIKALEIKQEEGRIYWKTEADVPKDVKIGPKAESIIRGVLESLNEQKKLTAAHLSLYDKFCPEEEK